MIARVLEAYRAYVAALVLQYVTGKGDKALPLMGEKAGFEKEFIMKPGKFKVMDSTEYKTGYNRVTKVIQLAAV
ncbi:MAG: hypothetical protein M0Q91_07620 [Methanoregula sp.]|jgi:hypothetical protein|nr:hypothetical protein [Methanoregula sp.]